jgi:hypothetical protein
MRRLWRNIHTPLSLEKWGLSVIRRLSGLLDYEDFTRPTRAFDAVLPGAPEPRQRGVMDGESRLFG